jgi:hypothetical protein
MGMGDQLEALAMTGYLLNHHSQSRVTIEKETSI